MLVGNDPKNERMGHNLKTLIVNGLKVGRFQKAVVFAKSIILQAVFYRMNGDC